MRETQASAPRGNELKQHFQHYFELLLGTERAELQRSIAIANESAAIKLLDEVEQRIAYLKGAVQMGKLLCLIDSEEAKMKHQILMTERERLLGTWAARRKGI